MGYLDGFGVTIKKWLGPGTETGRRVTTQYPEQTRPKPERFHGRHVLNRYEDGMEKCIGCELCAGVCPARCIYVRGADNDPDDPTSPGERYGFIYEINYLRCIHCDLCVEACPTEAITESKLFEFAFTNRSDAIYTKAELVVDDDGRPQQLPWENWQGGFDPAQDTSGWMRATAPGGDADFVGLVAWAGELGYGVRAPEGGGTVDPVVAEDLAAPAAPATTETPSAVLAAPTPAEAAPDEADTEVPPMPSSRARRFDAPEVDTSAPEPAPEAPDPAPAPTQRAGLFDAPEVAPRPSLAPESSPVPEPEPTIEPEPEPAIEPEPAAAAPEIAGEPETSETEAAAPEPDGADDTGPAPSAPAPAPPSSGPGFFDLPEPEPSEPEPKRRRFGRRGDRA